MGTISPSKIIFGASEKFIFLSCHCKVMSFTIVIVPIIIVLIIINSVLIYFYCDKDPSQESLLTKAIHERIDKTYQFEDTFSGLYQIWCVLYHLWTTSSSQIHFIVRADSRIVSTLIRERIFCLHLCKETDW